MPSAREIADFLDAELDVAGIPDYAPALNGLQLDHVGPVTAVAAAVDFSQATIEAAIAGGANLLLLHHGMFWGGMQRIVGPSYARLRALIRADMAVYSAHLPLDAHLTFGNCALLARALDLAVDGRFGEYQGSSIGVRGTTDLATSELVRRASAFAAPFQGAARASAMEPERRTRRWAVLTGAGADAATLRACAAAGVDTLIVGEGPHHTTVDAPEFGVVIIYAGHYATETLGVRALGDLVARRFGIPAVFLSLPTGS